MNFYCIVCLSVAFLSMLCVWSCSSCTSCYIALEPLLWPCGVGKVKISKSNCCCCWTYSGKSWLQELLPELTNMASNVENIHPLQIWGNAGQPTEPFLNFSQESHNQAELGREWGDWSWKTLMIKYDAWEIIAIYLAVQTWESKANGNIGTIREVP